MLKIKDNVELKELEKLGFEDNNQIGKYEFWIGNTQALKINKWDRKITIVQCLILGNEVRILSIEIMTILYDLIQTGLVEKVEEEKRWKRA